MRHHVLLVSTDILEEPIVSIFRVERNSELGTMLTITGNKLLLMLMLGNNKIVNNYKKRFLG
jgi:hypothetical protein